LSFIGCFSSLRINFSCPPEGVQNLKKKHKRLEAELTSHEPAVKSVQEVGAKLMAESNLGTAEIDTRCRALGQSWDELKVFNLALSLRHGLGCSDSERQIHIFLSIGYGVRPVPKAGRVFGFPTIYSQHRRGGDLDNGEATSSQVSLAPSHYHLRLDDRN
jgi:hypothetical protein